MPVMTMLATVAMVVAIIRGTNTLVGLVLPLLARYAIMEIGISVRPLVCNTRNMICELLAVSFFGFSSCKLFIARKPNGVAALSRPSILALKFITICPMAGCFSG